MPIQFFPNFNVRFYDSNGNALAFGKVRIYYAGTTNHATTYNFSNNANPFPIVLDANGECELKGDQGVSYDIYTFTATEFPQKTFPSVSIPSAVSGGGGTNNHDELINREMSNQHPTSAITGLDLSLSTLGLSVSALGVSVSSIESALLTKVETTDPRLSDARTPLAHTQDWTTVTGKPSTFPPSAHGHVIGDVSGLSGALGDKVDVLNGTLEGLVNARGATIENDNYVNRGDQEFNPNRIDMAEGVLEAVNGQGQYVKIRKARQEEEVLGEADIDIKQTSGSDAIRITDYVGTNTARLNAGDLTFNGVSIFTTFLSAVSATLQKAYDTGAQIITSVAKGAVKLRRGTGADSDNVLEILNGAGAVTTSVKGDGTIDTTKTDASIYASTNPSSFLPLGIEAAVQQNNSPTTGSSVFSRLAVKNNSSLTFMSFVGFVAGSAYANAYRFWGFRTASTTYTEAMRLTPAGELSIGSATADAHAVNRVTADGRYLRLSGGTLTGVLDTIAIRSVPLRINATTVLSGNRQNITFYGSTASQTITIPLATGSGNMLRLSNVASVAVTLSFTDSTYLGASTFVLQPNESLILLDDASTKWVGYNAPSTTGYSVGDLRLIGLENTAIGQNSVTGERGHLVRMINGTGATSVKGNLVSASTTTDNQFVLEANEFDAFGVVAQSGIANGQECWIWVNGSTCEVLWENGQSSTRGYLAICAPTDGRALNVAVPSTNPAVGEHFKEIGHVLQSKASGANVMVLCQIHFN